MKKMTLFIICGFESKVKEDYCATSKMLECVTSPFQTFKHKRVSLMFELDFLGGKTNFPRK